MCERVDNLLLLLLFVGCCVCVLCASENKLGAEGGAAVAEAIKSCKQLTHLIFGCMYLVWLCVAGVTHCCLDNTSVPA